MSMGAQLGVAALTIGGMWALDALLGFAIRKVKAAPVLGEEDDDGRSTT